MQPIAEPLAVVLEEALALWRELATTAPQPGGSGVRRAARLLRAAEACHRALGGPDIQGRPRLAPLGLRRLDDPLPRGARPSRPGGALSARELEVLRLVATGRTDREIAGALCLSIRTVTTHVASVLRKLDADNRTAAATLALRSGLLGDRPAARSP